jgi:maltose O-acetyltransferase
MKEGKKEYIRGENSLKEEIVRTEKLLQQFNQTSYEADELKREILTELFGSAGEGISVEHDFHCDLGYNIPIGSNFYAGFNCTILDMAEVRIGDNCLIALNVGLYTAGHDINPIDRHKTGNAKPITIGNNV